MNRKCLWCTMVQVTSPCGLLLGVSVDCGGCIAIQLYRHVLLNTESCGTLMVNRCTLSLPPSLRSKASLFRELSELFAADENHMISRNLLNKVRCSYVITCDRSCDTVALIGCPGGHREILRGHKKGEKWSGTLVSHMTTILYALHGDDKR